MITVIPHRVPSPREIVMHTQSIIQNVLIKKKLEEQRENYRKRQDQQQQQQQQQVQQRSSSPVNSPAKQTMSPTPLAFTPTSVLRKMTADKEPDGANQFHQMNSIPAAVDGNSNHSRMSRGCLITPSIHSPKLPHSVDQVQNETLKMIFLHSAITNHANNNTTVDSEESALKTKYLCPLEQKLDTDDNSNVSATKEKDVNDILDINANENDDTKAASSSVTGEDNDTNNNSLTSLDEVLKTSSEQETLVDETDKATVSASSDEIENPVEVENVDSHNTTPLAIHENV